MNALEELKEKRRAERQARSKSAGAKQTLIITAVLLVVVAVGVLFILGSHAAG